MVNWLESPKPEGGLQERLIEVYSAQEDLIRAQQEAIMRLLHENVEQENMINVMMREHVD